MIRQGRLRLAAVAASSVMAFMALAGQQASAQLTWDWEGGSREVISFDSKYSAGQVIVSFGDRRLYFITKPGQAISYPIAVPREDARWEGVTSVSQKRINPSWTPTPSMIAKNPRLPRWVPGGHPMNPLGVRGIYLGSSMYRIHGTDAPWTIGTSASAGCIRLYNEDVLDLYPRVNLGAKVTVTYRKFTTSGVVSSASTKSSPSNSFFLFGGDDEPVKARPKRTPRAKAKTPDASKTATPAKKPAEKTAAASPAATPAPAPTTTAEVAAPAAQ